MKRYIPIIKEEIDITDLPKSQILQILEEYKGHQITYCKECNKVISQCRCIKEIHTQSPRITLFNLCDECKNK